jgi:perosamine synthetase
MAATYDKKLAINGGTPVLSQGSIQKWPPVDELDEKMVLESLRGDNHAFGPNCSALETEFAEWNGNDYAITTNSGTAALHMGLFAAGCGSGDEVIVTAYSWSSSATCILQHNCIPVFVDIDWHTMNIDVTKIEAAVTPKTKAIIVVHLHGLAVEMDPVMDIAKRHGLKVIEDACQAHGATYKGKKVGTIGDCGAFSFNQNKCMCSGEGGMFVTNDQKMLEDARMLWSFGETRTPVESRDYHVYAMGWMYRNNDLTAAFGRAQLSKLSDNLATTRANAKALDDNLQDVPNIILPKAVPAESEPNWYNYVIRFDMEALGHTDDAADFRGKILGALGAEGTRMMAWQQFILPAMTVFQARNGYGQGCPWNCPNAQDVDYSVENYPVATKHSDQHACVVMELRPPNGPDVAEATAKAIRKVMENVDQL